MLNRPGNCGEMDYDLLQKEMYRKTQARTSTGRLKYYSKEYVYDMTLGKEAHLPLAW